MPSSDLILALDQGTTSSRAIVFDVYGQIRASAQELFTQYYPQAGWVEHDALELWQTQLLVAQKVMAQLGDQAKQVRALGLTNQRETTLVWDAVTGQPLAPAIVWQDRRTAAICETLREEGWEAHIHQTTGLVLDAYFSGTKLHWLLENIPNLRHKAEQGLVRFGTVDTWILWQLSNGAVHATDYSNASRTLLYDINTLAWDEALLQRLNIPRTVLPEVKPSAGLFAYTDARHFGFTLPITGIAGDQQAALFGQCCWEEGMAKNTYGTGCFMLMNTGNKRVYSKNRLLSTLAWGLDAEVSYALEGSVFVAGAAIQWLRDEMGLIDEAADSAYFAAKVEDTNGCYLVPAFTGLAAPYWDMYARGTLVGLTRGVNKNHVIRATLESLAYQTKDLIEAMQADAELNLQALRVDGGASANDFLMQFQADMLGLAVERPQVIETTALGAAYLAALGGGIWTKEQILAQVRIARQFQAERDASWRDSRYRSWKRAVEKAKAWLQPD